MGKNQSASGLTNIIQYDNNGNVSFVSGSTTLMQISSSGAITTTGVISGSNALSSSYALNSGLLNSTGSVGFATTASLLTVSSSQQQISASQQQLSSSFLILTASFNAVSSSQQQISASYIALSASYTTFSGSASTRITVDSASLLQVSASQQQISASLLQVSASYIALSGSYNTFSGSESIRITKIENNYATTGSNSFRADQSITGSLVVSSTITAQTLVVQTVTSSIVYSSGSNNFGNQLANTQTFTGSVNITGSLALAGNITGNAITLTGALGGTSASFSSYGYFNGANGQYAAASRGLVEVDGAASSVFGLTVGNVAKAYLYTTAIETLLKGYGNLILQAGNYNALTFTGSTGAATFINSVASPYYSFTGAIPSSAASTGYIDYSGGGTRFFSVGTSGATKGTFTFIAKGADNSSTTPLSISSTGAATFASGIGIGGATATTGGIQFPATQVAISDANNLDDYEEGTFTPTIQGSSTAGTGTYSHQIGVYTKIGNLVTINVWINWSAHTGTGDLLLAGFPFTSIGTSGYRASGTFGWVQNLTLSASNVATMAMSPSSTNASVTQYTVGGGAASGVPMDTAANLHYALTYQTS